MDIKEHFQLLLIPEKQKEESILLKNYFKNNPFQASDDPELLNILFDFFKKDSQYGINGVIAAARIIQSFVFYEYKFGRNPCLDSLLSNDFYTIIWPFFEKSSFIISIFQFLILLERKSIVPTCYYFLVDNNIITILTKLLDPNYKFVIEIFCLIGSFSSYHNRLTGRLKIESYHNFIFSIFKLIPKICQITFTSENLDIIEYGCFCLSSYSLNFSSVGLKIFQNFYFQNKIKNFERLNGQNQFEIQTILQLIDNILQNADTLEDNHCIFATYSKIRTESIPFLNIFIELIRKVLFSPHLNEKQEEKNENLNLITFKEYNKIKKICFSVLFHLYFTENYVDYLIEIGIVQFIFDLIENEDLIQSKIEAFAVIVNILLFANIDTVRFFIDNGFFSFVTENIDELMEKIPHQIIEAFECINSFGETEKQCDEWRGLIFDNDAIVEALEMASKGQYEDPMDSNFPLRLRAEAILARRFNEQI